VVNFLSDNLLEIQNLRTIFHTYDGELRAVDGADLTMVRGEALGIVGESGCGKSVASLSIMRLIPAPPGAIHAERMNFNGKDLLSLTDQEIRKIRGNQIAMIFQEPMTSLNPVFTIGDQIGETLMLHQGLNKSDARKKTIDLLTKVGIPAAAKRADDYPHRLSGGMRQRVMIAMALACAPLLLIADEPTTALDVTIQAQILDLLRQLQQELGMAIILITHDLAAVADLVKRVVVMYAGIVVEDSAVTDLFARPLHPYTQGLIAAIPRLDVETEWLNVIPGGVPNPLHLPSGCRFHPRCRRCMAQCRMEKPPMFRLGQRMVRCWLYQGGNNQ
jgi:oligopeptide/dipeptide ABC transporter ATP-binding protein